MFKCINIISLFFFLPVFISAQVNVKDSVISAPLFGISYMYQIPGGDMVKHFGNNSNIGGYFLMKTKGNLLFGVDGGFLFGESVKDSSVLNNIKTSQGWIITNDGKAAQVFLYERGFSLSARVGKLLPFKKPNPNSGIVFLSGLGFLQHKMRIEITGNNVPELTREYRRGYDRLAYGLALSQFVGYQYLSSRRLVNFFGGFELMAAFTKNRRGYNYDTMSSDNKNYFDLLYGFRFGWTLPLYKKMPSAYYFH